MLTDTQHKYLTELLGECWHEWGRLGYCPKCGAYIDTKCYRTFTTPHDFFDVVNNMYAVEVADVLDTLCDYPEQGLTSLATAMQQPDFIERFMSELCKLKGVE
jgi:hypothetical protein